MSVKSLKLKTKLTNLRRPNRVAKTLPASWIRAAGILGGKRRAMERHLKRVRSEWH